MSDNIFIKKRQRQRKKRDGFLTTKIILRLIIVSVVLLLLFLNFVGDPTVTICENGCDSEFSIGTWALGLAMIFGAIILMAGLVGAGFAVLKWSRGNSGSSFADIMDDDQSGS